MTKVLTTLDEVLDDLMKTISAPELVEYARMSESDLVKLHHTFGRYLRNDLGLWDKDGALYKWFKSNMGLWHADDTSTVILVSLWRKLNGLDLNLDGQAQFYLNYWRDMGYDADGNKVNDGVDSGVVFDYTPPSPQ